MTALLEKRGERRIDVIAKLIALYVDTGGGILVSCLDENHKDEFSAEEKSYQERKKTMQYLMTHPYADCWYETNSNRKIELSLKDSQSIHQHRLETFGFSFRDGALTRFSSWESHSIDDSQKLVTEKVYPGFNARASHLLSEPEIDCYYRRPDNASLTKEECSSLHFMRLRKYGYSQYSDELYFMGSRGGVYYINSAGNKVYI